MDQRHGPHHPPDRAYICVVVAHDGHFSSIIWQFLIHDGHFSATTWPSVVHDGYVGPLRRKMTQHCTKVDPKGGAELRQNGAKRCKKLVHVCLG